MAETGGCTKRSGDVRDHRGDLNVIGLDVVGISPDTPADQLAFDEKRDEDQVFELKGLMRLVDGEVLAYVDGSEIDYVDALIGAGFKVNNPNVVAACGCGSSFRVAGTESCSPV